MLALLAWTTSLVVTAADLGPPFTVELSGGPLAPGQPGVVLVRPQRPLASLSAGLFGRQVELVPWANGRYLGLVGVGLDDPVGRAPLTLSYALEAGEVMQVELDVDVVDRAYPSNTLRVARRFVRPGPAARRQIRRERRELAELWREPSRERLWRGNFILPRQSELTSVFGVRRIFNGRLRSRHKGIDLDGSGGEPVAAANRGRVLFAGSRYYSGRTVILDHGLGLYTLYFHLRSVEVAAGQLVERGTVIGKLGSTGRVTGPHLHFAVRLSGIYVDPVTFLQLELAADPLASTAATRPASGPVSAPASAPASALEATAAQRL
ncbi:MAG: M23 family metallopeptidase [Deltaproteobacteria bacterium]|nr:M23 family metallopeptidase [Deltaproteobacteria bacterium]